MRNISKILIGIGVISAIVLVGAGIGWFSSHNAAPTLTPRADALTPVPAPVPPPPPTVPKHTEPTPVTGPRAIATAPAPAAPAATNLLANWEDQLDNILVSDDDDTNKVKQLFQMFPNLPEEGQVEVAQHLSNLVSDKDYGPLGQLLENAKLPEDVLDVLMADVLNRPNAMKLPLLLDVAQNPDNSKSGEAKDLLELYLDEDYGTDWATWRQKMQDWLKENPD